MDGTRASIRSSVLRLTEPRSVRARQGKNFVLHPERDCILNASCVFVRAQIDFHNEVQEIKEAVRHLSLEERRKWRPAFIVERGRVG